LFAEDDAPIDGSAVKSKPSIKTKKDDDEKYKLSRAYSIS
jgi:hypothetical protein